MIPAAQSFACSVTIVSVEPVPGGPAKIIQTVFDFLFVGNDRGGRTAAILSSLTSTCRRLDVDPQLYLTQLLMNLPQAKMNELSDWLPDQWKLRHAARMATLNAAPARTQLTYTWVYLSRMGFIYSGETKQSS